MKKEVFRLLNLHLQGKTWDNVDLDFLSNELEWSNTDVFTSLLIGVNGTGKSHILSIIAGIFRDLEAIISDNKNVKTVKRLYAITYQLNNHIFRIENDSKNKIHAFRDNQQIPIFEVNLPIRIIASAFMVTDKFTYAESNTNNTSIYKYLGIRGNSTGAGTKTHLKKVGENIIKSSTDPKFINKLKYILSFLGLKSNLVINFEVRKRKYFFDNHLQIDDFISFFKNWRNRSKRITEPFFVKHFDVLEESEISGLVSFLNSKKDKLLRASNGSILKYELNLDDYASNAMIQKDFIYIKKLMLLDILSSPNIEIEKETTFGLEYASSGEYHFIFTMINILSNIDKNSLVLIDEPEISLHPNWQVNYIAALREIFNDYSSCHFILATHSHFMISDLKHDSSSIISLKKEVQTGKLITLLHNENTFGWAAEDILYNIFEVPTTRNYYLANEVGQILYLISQKDQDRMQIVHKIEKIKRVQLQLKEVDPLKQVINTLIGRFDKK